MRENERFAARVFSLVVLAVLGYLLFRVFRPFFGPVFWAMLLALMLWPANVRLRRRVGQRRGLAATILTLAVTLGIVVPAGLIGVAFANQGIELAQTLSKTLERYRIVGVEDVVRLPFLGKLVGWLETHFHLDLAQIQEWLVRVTKAVVQYLLAHGRDVLFGAFGLIGDLTVMLFVLFFFYRDGDALMSRALALLPLEPGRKARLAAHLKGVTEAVVLGTIITALVQGALVAVAFWITGLPSPVVFGVLTAVASFIPLVGTSLVIGPAAIYLAATEGIWWKGLFMVLWGVVIAGSADNVLKPLLISGRAQIGTLPVFFGVIGGLSAFGLAGLFFGPVLVALALVLIEFVEEANLARPGAAAAGGPAPAP